MRRALAAALAGAAVTTALAAPAVPAAAAGATRVVVDDAADTRAHIDLRRVTYRLGERMMGFSAVVDDLPPAGYVDLGITNPDAADDSVDIVLERRADGVVSVFVDYNFLEDAGGGIRCHTIHQWDQTTDVVGVSVSRACVTRAARAAGRTFRFDRLVMAVSTSSRGYRGEDASGPVRLDS